MRETGWLLRVRLPTAARRERQKHVLRTNERIAPSSSSLSLSKTRDSPLEKAEIASLMLPPGGAAGAVLPAGAGGPPAPLAPFGAAAEDGGEAASSPSALTGDSDSNLRPLGGTRPSLLLSSLNNNIGEGTDDRRERIKRGGGGGDVANQKPCAIGRHYGGRVSGGGEYYEVVIVDVGNNLCPS